MEVGAGDSLSEFSKCWLLLQKAHEKEINAVREEGEKWKGLYEAERDLVSSLQKQLNVEVERLQKLLNIAESKITEKEAKIVEKDEQIFQLESMVKAKTAEKETEMIGKDKLATNFESLIKANIENQSNNDSKNSFTMLDNTGGQSNNSIPADEMGNQPHTNGGSVNTSPGSPSLLENPDPPSTTPSRSHGNDVNNHRWMKRKKRRKLKQTTLTQHQSLDRKRQKLDHSVKVVPQTPCINLSSGSSDEDEHPTPDVVSDDTSDEYDTDNVISQNCDKTNQDYTFVPDSSQKDITNQDITFVDNIASQACEPTSQNCDHTNDDFIPLVKSRAGVSHHLASTTSTNHNQSTAHQHLKDKRNMKRSSSDPKCVEVCRKKSDRNKLDAAPCHECAQWYADDPEAIKKVCRHRFKHPPPNTPADFWDIGFPDTVES